MAKDVVLVGGQGQHFWVELYAPEVPDLRADIEAHGPLTSKDIDFVGTRAAAERYAQHLHGRLQVASMDHATPNPLVIHYRGRDGHERVIDFLDRPHGVMKASEVYDTAVSVEFLESSLAASGRGFRVIHPVLSMECRLSNVADIPKYQTDKGIRQARASILCAREYLKRRLEVGAVRDVLNMNERIFRFRTSPTGHKAAQKFQLDAFTAVLLDERLPERFRTVRYAQMQRTVEELDRRRGRGAPGVER